MRERTEARLLKQDRAFGITLGVALAAIAALKHRPLPAILAVALLVTALARPQLLRRASRAWYRFGELLSTLTQPVVLAVFYFGVFSPFAILMRALGKNTFQARPAGASFWRPRQSESEESSTRWMTRPY